MLDQEVFQIFLNNNGKMRCKNEKIVFEYQRDTVVVLFIVTKFENNDNFQKVCS